MAERVDSDSEGSVPQLSELTGVSNVLFVAPSIGSAGTDACFDLLTQAPPEQANVLSITYTRSPQEFIDHYEDHAGMSPVRGGIVTIGEGDASVDNPAWAVKGVENPSDLTGVGIELSELLSGIATAAGEDEDIVICFDSITSLLQYADLQRAFRFLHVVTGRVKTVGGIGHYHVDPEAHDRQDMATLKGLFDAIAEVDEDGSVSIQQ